MGGFGVPVAKPRQNIRNASAGFLRFEANLFAEVTVVDQRGRALKKAENVAVLQRPFMGEKRDQNVSNDVRN